MKFCLFPEFHKKARETNRDHFITFALKKAQIRQTMKSLSTFFLKQRTLLLRLLCGTWALWILWHALWLANHFAPRYDQPNFSDWMINYQGGFVRRGLAGEVLWQIYQYHPYPVHLAILTIMGVTMAILVWLITRVFRKEGWSPVLLLTPLLIIPVNLCWHDIWTRRDCLSLLLTAAAFSSFFHYAKRYRLRHILLFHLVALSTLLLHEASFFYTFPILILWLFLKKRQMLRWDYALGKTLLLFSPEIAAMFAVCLFKGDRAIAEAIFSSWQPAMTAFPLGEGEPTMGMGLDALAWDTLATLRMHLHSFCGYMIKGVFPSILGFFYCLAAGYYLFTRMNTVDLKVWRLRPLCAKRLSDVMIIQFVFLLPLFTLLSCDSGRTVPYWICSSLLFCHFAPKGTAVLPIASLNHISFFLQEKIEKSRLLSSPYMWLFVAATLPLSCVGGMCFGGGMLAPIPSIVTRFFIDSIR